MVIFCKYDELEKYIDKSEIPADVGGAAAKPSS
jgi:hypothetical protein